MYLSLSILSRLYFQFTTSQGGRQGNIAGRSLTNAFQFTTSQGGRRGDCVEYCHSANLSIHDLTRRSTMLHLRH